MLTKNLAATALLAVLALLLAPVAQAEVHEVRTVRTGDSAAPFAFEPASLTVAVGDTVRWVNGDGTYHTTTNRARDGGGNGDLWSGVLDSQGVEYEFTFTEAGTYEYFCQPHASFMEGVVVVTEAGGGGGGSGSGSSGDEEAPGVALPLVLAAVGVAAMARRR